MRIETWIFFLVAAVWIVSATLLAIFVNQGFFLYLAVFLIVWPLIGLGLRATMSRRRPSVSASARHQP